MNFYRAGGSSYFRNPDGSYPVGDPGECCCEEQPRICTPCGPGNPVPKQQIVSPGSNGDFYTRFWHFSNFESYVLDFRDDGPPAGRPTSIYPWAWGMPTCYWTLTDGDWVMDVWYLGNEVAHGHGTCCVGEVNLVTGQFQQFYTIFPAATNCVGPWNPYNAGSSKFVRGA